MSKEDLLKERFVIIADYPGNNRMEGEIIPSPIDSYSQDEISALIFTCKNFPKIFKKLEWYEERKVEDMPKYLKQILDDGKTTYEKIISWNMKYLIGMIDDRYCCDLMLWKGKYQYQPATEEEYLSNLAQLEGVNK